MSAQKPKSIHQIEERMEALSPESFRYRVLDSARAFKSSWIELGQYLFTVYKDKLYKDWEYLTFEAYCSKEIGIRQNTAMKLLKSYSFLEKEEPTFLKRQSLDETKPAKIPGYESVNALRLAKESEKLSSKDYEELREDVLDDVKEEGEVKKKIRYILKTGAKHAQPTEEETKGAALKKLTMYLQNYKNDPAILNFPAKITKKIDELLDLLADYQK